MYVLACLYTCGYVQLCVKQDLPWLFATLFLRQCLSVNLKLTDSKTNKQTTISLILLDWLTCKLQDPVSLYVPTKGITDDCEVSGFLGV